MLFQLNAIRPQLIVIVIVRQCFMLHFAATTMICVSIIDFYILDLVIVGDGPTPQHGSVNIVKASNK
jgi:hypothetical protein